MTDLSAPYATLTPDRVLAAVESVGLHCDGRLLALNSYENRVYRVGVDDAPAVIAKFYRAGRWSDAAILEEHAFAAELVAAEIPIVPPLAFGRQQTLLRFEDLRFALFPNRPGRAPELDDSTVLEWIGRYLGRIHARGRTKKFKARQRLSTELLGHEPVRYLLAGDFIPNDLRPAYESVAEACLAQVEACFSAVGPYTERRLHGDCHPGNILWTAQGPHFVDLDDCMSGPAVQDIWMLLAGTREERARQLDDVLRGYCLMENFDATELGLIEALRTLRQIHYAAWLARRWQDPAFPLNFPWFNGQRYWQDHVLALREQIAAMEEPALDWCRK